MTPYLIAFAIYGATLPLMGLLLLFREDLERTLTRHRRRKRALKARRRWRPWLPGPTP